MMTKIEIAILCAADAPDYQDAVATHQRARARREDTTSRFYILDGRGARELRIEHGLITLWVARRSRLRPRLR
jgi:hypothetical protein